MKITIGVYIFLIVACSTIPKQRHVIEPTDQQLEPVNKPSVSAEPKVEKPRWLELDHKYFQVFYDSKLRLARYVRYESNADVLSNKVVERKNNFHPDPLLIENGVPFVKADEYKYSGYDRGHLAPSGDFVFSREANDETFVMSNMAPQTPSLNRQAWKALEDHTRKWVCGEGKAIIITGPVIEPGLRKLDSGLPIPNRFFKIVIDNMEPRKALGFVYSQNDASDVYKERVVRVSEIERLIHENFESEIPLVDRHIFSDAPDINSWRVADCGRQATSKYHIEANGTRGGPGCPAGTALKPASIQGCCRGHSGVAGPKKASSMLRQRQYCAM